MADHQETAFTLPTDPVSVGAARRHVAAVLAEWGLPKTDPAADSVQLIVSELASNVVRHAAAGSPTFTVEVRLERHEQLRIGVTDGHPQPPRRLPVAVHRDTGRGMLIVQALAAEAQGSVSVAPAAEGGKTVWVALPWKASSGSLL